MRSKPLFIFAGIGIISGLGAAFIYNRQKPPLPPVFQPAPNPYGDGIYATGIVESYQRNGENINLYPEVSGTVVEISVAEGQAVHRGDPILKIDDSVQRGLTEQQKAQAEAAFSLLEELKAQPRKETLAVNEAQVEASRATLKNVQDQLSKLKHSYQLSPKSVSRDALDNAINAVKVADKNLVVAIRQYDLTRAGAWIYDIQNQERQYRALSRAHQSSQALLDKYQLRAPADGIVMAIKTSIGSFVSSQGVYETYTQGLTPAVVMGSSENELAVRTYVDEILVHRLPDAAKMEGQMFIRGTNISVPLQFVRVQPYVSPKIQLSDQRLERVDVRVLPVLFKFERPSEIHLFPGQLVDVYLSGNRMNQNQMSGTAGQPSPLAKPGRTQPAVK